MAGLLLLRGALVSAVSFISFHVWFRAYYFAAWCKWLAWLWVHSYLNVRRKRIRNRIPVRKPARHVVLCVEWDADDVDLSSFVASVCEQIDYSLQLGCEYVTVYEKTGALKSAGASLPAAILEAENRRERSHLVPMIEFSGASSSGSVAVSVPRVAKDGNASWHQISKCSRQSISSVNHDINDETPDAVATVRLVDESDGRHDMVRLCSPNASNHDYGDNNCIEMLSVSTRLVPASSIIMWSSKSGLLSEGFPPLLLKSAELYYVGKTPGRMNFPLFVRAAQMYFRSEQRWGR